MLVGLEKWLEANNELADWVSGIGSLLAVVVALGGYWLVERHRQFDEKKRRQDAAYQIAFKLSALASDAHVTHRLLNPPEKTTEDWLSEQDPMEICGKLHISIGATEPVCRDLNEAEQNLLMSLKEEDFLMDFSEAFARNQSIEAGLKEYTRRRDAITATLPAPAQFRGQIGSFDLTQEEVQQIYPALVACSSLVQSMRVLSKTNIEQLSSLSEKYRPMMSGHFPKLHVHTIQLNAET